MQPDFLFQEREKGLRIHLGEAIDELKKYNARRKLKASILSAVNSSKWYPYDDINEDALSDFGDDEVSSCGKWIFFVMILCAWQIQEMSKFNSTTLYQNSTLFFRNSILIKFLVNFELIQFSDKFTQELFHFLLFQAKIFGQKTNKICRNYWWVKFFHKKIFIPSRNWFYVEHIWTKIGMTWSRLVNTLRLQ